jgi:4-hydroxybenzoate polyprenyltransferase
MPLTLITCFGSYLYYIGEFQYSLCIAIAAFLIVFSKAVDDDQRDARTFLNVFMLLIYTAPVAYLMTVVSL